MTVTPELIIISVNPETLIAEVSFSDTRQHKIKYDIENTKMLSSSATSMRLRKVPKGRLKLDGNVKEPLETSSRHKTDKRYLHRLQNEDKKLSKAIPIAKHKTKTELKTAVVTYRDAAKALIRGEVENGADIQTLKSRQPGYSGDEYEAQVGGRGFQKKYSIDKIIVTELRGRKLKPAAIFSLREIYNEIKKSS